MGQNISMAFAFIATRQHANLCDIPKQSHNIFHMGRLARATYRYISYGDYWDIERSLSENAYLKKIVSHAYAYAVKPTQWQQPIVNFDKIALCAHV